MYPSRFATAIIWAAEYHVQLREETMFADLRMGRESLVFAFSVLLVGGLIVSLGTGMLALSIESQEPIRITAAVFVLRLAFFIYAWIAVWRCAPNAPLPALTRIARWLVVLHVIIFSSVYWVIFSTWARTAIS